jgi:hypothetical protein
MEMFKLQRQPILVMVVALVVAGCFGEEDTSQADPVTSGDDSQVSAITVTGTIRSVNDMTPVDGGVTIVLATDESDTVTLLFPSLFTSPPPDQKTLDLYEIVRELKPEDRVRATGTLTDYGIQLEELAILK